MDIQGHSFPSQRGAKKMWGWRQRIEPYEWLLNSRDEFGKLFSDNLKIGPHPLIF